MKSMLTDVHASAATGRSRRLPCDEGAGFTRLAGANPLADPLVHVGPVEVARQRDIGFLAAEVAAAWAFMVLVEKLRADVVVAWHYDAEWILSIHTVRQHLAAKL
jgi:hypothetical protein